MSAGVQLAKYHFRELLEEKGFKLTDRQRMTDIYIYSAFNFVTKIKIEIARKDLSVILDGTTRLGKSTNARKNAAFIVLHDFYKYLIEL